MLSTLALYEGIETKVSAKILPFCDFVIEVFEIQ